MKLTSWGAAEQVTGSMHMLQLDSGYTILIDCGMDYEKNVSVLDNEQFPFLPHEIDLVILTHAHVDHSGNLPTLVRAGYMGQILCTAATRDLSELLLSDSVEVFLHKSNKGKKRNKRSSKGSSNNDRPLYLHKHVMDTVDRIVTIPFHHKFSIQPNIDLEFIPTGHLLGAAAVKLTVREEKEKTISFSGDIGRINYPILADPEFITDTEYLVCESTYGGRFHSSDRTMEEVLMENINDTCVKEPGRLIIPAFSIGRTQALVFALHRLFQEKKLPPIKVFVDSPLGMAGTSIYRKHHALLNEEAQNFFENFGDEFEFDGLKYVENLRESQQISNYYEPCIIISSAGMLEGGRIQDHLYHNIQNYYARILFIGYCARGTLGRRLLDGESIVKINGRELSVFASIKQTDLFSAHADHKGLLDYICASKNTLKQVFLVHGEPKSLEAMKLNLDVLQINATIMQKGITYENL